MPAFYEFFAGAGMARAGLGNHWSCLFANDFDAKKGAAYTANWGTDELVVRDVAALSTSDIPEDADLAWASFPCQDLSLAGAGAGLKGERSGTFWYFWQLLRTLDKEQRAPKIVVLENVCGALWSHDGKDFAAIGAPLRSKPALILLQQEGTRDLGWPGHSFWWPILAAPGTVEPCVFATKVAAE